jgi:uncharacterized protein
MRAFDAVVVGAGPAGLSAAAELASAGARCLIVDGGAPAHTRRRDVPEDLLAGVGGAGLFSDGKHSFFPSASRLWSLPDREVLAAAFAATAALLARYGVAAGELPAAPAPPLAAGTWHEKHYPALYVPFAERQACIAELWAACGERWTLARVLDAERVDHQCVLVIERAGETLHVAARHVVVATGRWSPRWIRSWLGKLDVLFAFQRTELGVRLEASTTHPLFARLPGVDGKLVWRDATSEIRTFCTCRDGEVVLGRAHGMAAYSGRADGPPTGRSNVGLVVRITDRELNPPLDRLAPATFALADWLAGGAAFLAPQLGELAAQALQHALERLRAWEPRVATGDVRAYAPVIEGVGDYPADDGRLALAPGVWICGDACGRFRGIVASMVSGRYVARRITVGT